MRRNLKASIAVLGVIAACSSQVGASGFPGIGGFTPQVPVSAFARPAAWFDPSRLQFSTSVSVGSGFGGRADALQVTTMSYRFEAPVWMSVSLGNTWGSTPGGRGTMFLEGLDLGYRPHPSLLVQIHYRDIRSPLQMPAAGYGYWPR